MSEQSKHTPGPWAIDEIEGFAICAVETGFGSIEVRGPSMPDVVATDELRSIGMANARLIAAAPDLLSALLDLCTWVTLDMVEMQRGGHTVSHLAASLDRAREATKKALEGSR